MIALDASVLIAHLDDDDDAHHDRATRLLLDTAGEAFCASPLTLAEVLVGPARAGKLDVAESAIRDLEIATLALGEDAPVRLAQLRATTRLPLPDCCVCRTAAFCSLPRRRRHVWRPLMIASAPKRPAWARSLLLGCSGPACLDVNESKRSRQVGRGRQGVVV
jgi:predicted nucleic acid-binding protein